MRFGMRLKARRELIDGRCRLKVAENVCIFVEHDRFAVKEARQTIEHWLYLYISMNEDLTWELKAVHYKFARFLEGAGTRSGMGEASMVDAKFFMGT